MKNGCAVLQRQSRQKCPMQHRMLETFITFPRSGQDVIKVFFLCLCCHHLKKRRNIMLIPVLLFIVGLLCLKRIYPNAKKVIKAE